jgi:hypothetical protein
MAPLQDPPLDAIDEKRRQAFHLDGGADADGDAHAHDHDKPVDEAKRESWTV